MFRNGTRESSLTVKRQVDNSNDNLDTLSDTGILQRNANDTVEIRITSDQGGSVVDVENANLTLVRIGR